MSLYEALAFMWKMKLDSVVHRFFREIKAGTTRFLPVKSCLWCAFCLFTQKCQPLFQSCRRVSTWCCALGTFVLEPCSRWVSSSRDNLPGTVHHEQTLRLSRSCEERGARQSQGTGPNWSGSERKPVIAECRMAACTLKGSQQGYRKLLCVLDLLQCWVLVCFDILLWGKSLKSLP